MKSIRTGEVTVGDGVTVLHKIPAYYPESCRFIAFSELQTNQVQTDRYIVGTINNITDWKANSAFRQCYISDEFNKDGTGDEKWLRVFLFDDSAKQSEMAQVNGYLAISNFYVEKLTLQHPLYKGKSLYPVQVIVKDALCNSANIVILKKKDNHGAANIIPVDDTALRENATTSNPSTSKGLQPGEPNTQNRVQIEKTNFTAPQNKRSAPVTTNGLSQAGKRQRNSSDSDSSQSSSIDFMPTKKKKTAPKTTPMNNGFQNEQVRTSPLQDATTNSMAAKVYQYTTLNDLSASTDNQHLFHIFGVIDGFNYSLAKGKLEVTASDQTKSKFSVFISISESETVPNVELGDVIRIHRMFVNSIRGVLKGSCMLAKFVVVFSHKDKGQIPKSCAAQYTLTDQDKTRVAELLEWNENRKWFLISDVTGDLVDQNINIMGQIVAVTNTLRGSCILTIWDGTKTKLKVTHMARNFAKCDDELFNISRDYSVHLWVMESHIAEAEQLMPGDFVEVINATLFCQQNQRPEEASLSLPNFPVNLRRSVGLVQEESERLSRLKRRLDEIKKKSTNNPNVPLSDDIPPSEDISFLLNSDLSFSEISEGAPTLSNNNANVNRPTSISTDRDETFLPLGISGRVNEGASTSAGNHPTINQGTSTSTGNNPTVSKEARTSTSPTVNKGASTSAGPAQPIEKSRENVVTLADEIAGINLFLTSQNVDGAVLANHGSQNETPAEIQPATASQNEGELREGSSLEIEQLLNQSIFVTCTQPQTGEGVPHTQVATQNEGITLTQVAQLVDSESTQNPRTINCSIFPSQPTQRFGPLDRDGNVPYDILSTNNNASLLDDFQYRPLTQPGQGHDWWQNITSVSTILGHKEVNPCKLNEIEKHAVPYKFRVMANVTDIKPSIDKVRNVVRLFCTKCNYLSENSEPRIDVVGNKDGLLLYRCPLCEHEHLEYIFLLWLTLVDDTHSGGLTVMLWKDFAVEFFRGITPQQLLTNEENAAFISKMLCQACPNIGPQQNTGWQIPPFLDCCIMSYSIDSPENSTKYQMFDTVMNMCDE